MQDSSEKKIVSVTLQAQALALGGSFIGSIEASSVPENVGKKAFVRGVVPGERFEARVYREDGKFVEAELTKILTESPDRIAPLCRFYETCGGCDLQHMKLPAQREAKRRMVEDTLRIHGGLVPTHGVTLVGEDLPGFNYRRRIALHLDREGNVGFFRRNTKTIVPINRCEITDEGVNQALLKIVPILDAYRGIRGDLIIESHEGQVFVLIKILQRYFEDKSMEFPPGLLSKLKETFPNVKVSHSTQFFLHQVNFVDQLKETAQSAAVGHFSQVNEHANEVLVSTAIAECEAAHVTELYAGAGNFTLPLARQGAQVDAVEASRELVRFGETRARESGLGDRITFFRESCEKFCKTREFRECVLLDPPRSGAPAVVEKLLQSPQVKRLVYVSCYLPTLCRDMKALAEVGFKLERTYVIDMFAQTHHVETISVMVRE